MTAAELHTGAADGEGDGGGGVTYRAADGEGDHSGGVTYRAADGEGDHDGGGVTYRGGGW